VKKVRRRESVSFFNDKGESSQNIVISTDGQRTVYTTPNAGKKLNQAPERERRDPDLEQRRQNCTHMRLEAVL
jgi:hypothetical protein